MKYAPILILVVAAQVAFNPTANAASNDRKAKTVTIEVLGKNTPAEQHKAIVLNDPASPVQITGAALYRLTDEGRIKLEFAVPRYERSLVPKGAIVEISAQSKTAVAVIFGIKFVDAFGENVSGFAPVLMSRLQDKPLPLRYQSDRLPTTFKKWGIGCVFVQKARLSDGQVWQFDANTIGDLRAKHGC